MTLLAVGLLGGPAAADPTPTPPSPAVLAAAPRVLATGAPACGNVMFKPATEDLLCPVFRNLRELEALGRKYAAELQERPITTASLTVLAPPRPGL